MQIKNLCSILLLIGGISRKERRQFTLPASILQHLLSSLLQLPAVIFDSHWQLLFLYLLQAAIHRFLRFIPLFLLLDQRFTFSVHWTWSCYLQQTKIIITNRECIYLCYLDWYLLKGAFFSKMEIRKRFLNWFLLQLPHTFICKTIRPPLEGDSHWSFNKPRGAVTMFCSAM